MRRSVLAGILAAAAMLATASCSTSAESGKTDGQKSEFPSKSIRLVIPYAAGGPTDLVGRAVASYWEKELGWKVIPENKPGAGAAIGMRDMIKSKADGHTLAITGSNAAVVTPIVVKDAGYTDKDFVNVGAVSEFPYIIAVGKKSGITSPEDFFAKVKEKPGTISLAAPSGTGQISVDIQHLEQQGAKISIVPFNGNSEAIAAMLGGNVHGIIQVASKDTLAQISSGEAIPMAVLSAKRAPYLPDVPTVVELGFAGIDVGTSYFGIGAPAGVPADVLATLEEALEKALADPATRRAIGEEFIPTTFIGSAALDGLFAKQREYYAPAIQKLVENGGS
ncbi:tripartite tricarboxylate transporter substrate binding protein [Rhizomonospora bruguierae]|uniref:tripartite tricarboxylate transporter substrate binding protein n=1 Tax=Rhizomonospora bruguierae TaxID=1581705 RepID=UPI001BD13A3E|nr:tripartite tricarboxylate transporter substrate binding protein [Micromonospora sp. NBRC 107566]